MKKLIIILSALLYANQTSASDIGTQMNNLSNFVKKNVVGNQDFWLQMETSYGWENVALVVGYYDDYDACTELIAGLEATQFFNKRNYRCYAAN